MATFGPLPRERTTKALVSLQRVVTCILRCSAVLVEVSEKLTDLNAKALNLGLSLVVGEIAHSSLLYKEVSS
jgi:hypothetical protein